MRHEGNLAVSIFEQASALDSPYFSIATIIDANVAILLPSSLNENDNDDFIASTLT